ncbi:MAG: CD225/dispanin family protein [Candidatus Sulfotelmatobacter sp.]
MPNYLVFAILATVLCCLPTGIAAIVYAGQVNGELQAGDIAGAQAASKNAKMWCWISFGVGLAFSLIYGIIVAAGIMSHMNH